MIPESGAEILVPISQRDLIYFSIVLCNFHLTCPVSSYILLFSILTIFPRFR